ncbi:MAG: O-antigen ligase family protein [Victivallales bacterium]|nr:O-antigen ligase family protein [Victivallales bacterium]
MQAGTFSSESNTWLGNRLSSLLAVAFLLLVAMKYPLLVLRPLPSGIEGLGIYLSSPAQLSAFALLMILMQSRRLLRLFYEFKPLFLSSFTMLLVIVTTQFIIQPKYGLDEFCLSISWFSIPMAVCLYFPYFRRLLLPFIAFLWLFSMVHTIWQLIGGIECVGIPANRNWHGAFLICSTPFLIYWLYNLPWLRLMSGKMRLLLLILPCAVALYALWMTSSRGANLSLALAATMFFVLRYFDKLKNASPRVKRIIIASILMSPVVIAVLSVLFAGNIAAMISHDVRIPLWRGAVEMFADNPLLGVGVPGYEGEYSYYMPIEKFLRSHHFAGRADHPHNQILFFAGAFGIAGLLASLYLAVAPIAIFIQKYKHSDAVAKLVFFGFIMLLTHSMLDMVAEKWPTAQMLQILQGLMWHYTFRRPEVEPACNLSTVHTPATLRFCCSAVAVLFLACSSNMLPINARASYHARNSAIAKEFNHYAGAIKHRLESLRIAPDALGLYECAMMSLFWLNDHLLAYKYFAAMEANPSRIVVHSNARMAECLLRMNRKSEALKYMDLETKAFPLSSLALYNLLLLQKELGNNDAAEITAEKLIRVIKFKGLDVKDLKAIFDDPGLDHRFYKLKE